MKKTVKSLVLALIIGIMVISLTGCGSDKLVATKTVEDENGNYKEEIIITFKKNKVETIEVSMEFEDEEAAQGMYLLLNLGMQMNESGEEIEEIKIEQEGKKLIFKVDGKTYAETEGISEKDLTKEALKKSLEKDGYTVK